MEFSFIYITVLLVSLIASVFVITTDIKSSTKSISKLDFRVISIQLIILLAWIIILSRALRATTLEEAIVNTAVFVFSLVMGVLVIQSVIKENKASQITNELVKSLSIYNRRLRNLDKQKTDFISTASHQLRGPLSIILGYSSMLLDKDYGELNDKQKNTVQNILNSGNNLNTIINELLDVSRIEQKRIIYKEDDFDIIDIIEESVETYTDLAKKRNIEIIEDYNKDYSIMVHGDKEKIKQVFSNLIDNSLKYTKEGKIIVSIDKILNKDSGKVLIKIKDTGIGIRQDEINGIFNKFSRASNAENSSILGSGLGLFIAREITISNKGNIWAKSEGQDKGSTFYVEFPVVN